MLPLLLLILAEDRFSRESLAECLAQRGLSVAICGSADDGRARAAQRQVDALICDIPSPDWEALAPEPSDDLAAAVGRFEKQHIERVLKATPSKPEAARRLGIGLSSLYRRIAKLGIQVT